MNNLELSSVLKHDLHEVGLESVVDQLLELPEGVWAEIVLEDASKLQDARAVIDGIRSRLQKLGISFDATVRARWSIVDVIADETAPRTLADAIGTGRRFRAKLKSASLIHEVEVEIAPSAIRRLEERIHATATDALVAVAVKDYLELQLSKGGIGFWDPLTQTRLQLGEATMSFLLKEPREFKGLRTAIDDFFGPRAVRHSLRDLKLRKTKIIDFGRVLPELSSHFGGGYRRGDTFSVSAVDLYESLDSANKAQIERYYQAAVAALPAEIKAEFSDLFTDRGTRQVGSP